MIFYLFFSIGLFLPRASRLPYLLAGMMLLQMGMHKLNPARKLYDNNHVFEFLGGIAVAVAYKSL